MYVQVAFITNNTHFCLNSLALHCCCRSFNTCTVVAIINAGWCCWSSHSNCYYWHMHCFQWLNDGKRRSRKTYRFFVLLLCYTCPTLSWFSLTLRRALSAYLLSGIYREKFIYRSSIFFFFSVPCLLALLSVIKPHPYLAQFSTHSHTFMCIHVIFFFLFNLKYQKPNKNSKYTISEMYLFVIDLSILMDECAFKHRYLVDSLESNLSAFLCLQKDRNKKMK